MAQNEEMKRLLKDGKIVGYEWHYVYEDFNEAGNMTISQTDDLSMVKWYGVSPNTIRYDSFELGIKVGEWWFENDLIEVGEYKYGSRHEPAFTGILMFFDYEWIIYDIDSMGINGVKPNDDRIKQRIGNIHKKGL